MKIQIDPQVLEIVKYNQLPDHNGNAHPNAVVFGQIEAELNRLCALANGGTAVDVNYQGDRQDRARPAGH